MAIATAPTTFLDLYRDLLNRVRADTTDTATVNLAKRYINQALLDLHITFGELMPWAHRTGLVRTKTPYRTGLAFATRGSGTVLGGVLGEQTTWATADEFGEVIVQSTGRVRFGAQLETYKVRRDSTSDTVLTLEEGFSGKPTAGSIFFGQYVYFESEYVLPDTGTSDQTTYLRPVSFSSFDTNDSIELIGRNEFHRRFPDDDNFGPPTVATIIDEQEARLHGPGATRLDAPRRRVMFHPIPDKEYRVTHEYITSLLAVTAAGVSQAGLVNDTDEPIVPLDRRHMIVSKALETWMRDYKDDERSLLARSEYLTLLELTVQPEIGSDRVSVAPRPHSVRDYDGFRLKHAGYKRSRAARVYNR